MKIISDIDQDCRSPYKVHGGYEWWYFDMLSNNGLSVVIIFYDGNPFSRRYLQAEERGDKPSPSDFPGITISICRDGKPLFYSFEEVLPDQAEFSENEPSGRVRENSFRLSRESDHHYIYTIQLRQKLPNGEHLFGTLKLGFNPRETPDLETDSIQSGSSSLHEWNLVVPRAAVTGTLMLNGTRSDFNGTGYHDHNRGQTPLKATFEEWYWGRYHFDTGMLIYYLMYEEGGWIEKAWLLDKEGKVKTNKIAAHLEDREYNLFGLLAARKIRFESEHGQLLLQKERRVDNGPFYQRYEGVLLGTLGETPIRGDGFSEYIRPPRINASIFRPLVDMRIKYPGKPHWVQKSRRLYRWTWLHS